MDNLYLKTIKEVYKMREVIGYKTAELGDMFVLCWNTPELAGFNAAHLLKLNDTNLALLQKNFNIKNLSLAVYEKPLTDIEAVQPSSTSAIMLFDGAIPSFAQKDISIKYVSTPDDMNIFCAVIGQAFASEELIPAYKKSLIFDLQIDCLHKYVVYKDNLPVGAMEVDVGSAAAVISWVGILEEYRRQGLCSAMLSNVLMTERNNGCTKFVLAAGEDSAKVYQKFGFKTILTRYNCKAI